MAHLPLRTALAALAAVLAQPAFAAFVVSVEAPRAQTTSSAFSYVGTETFDSRATGTNQNFSSNFGGNSGVTGTYTGVQVSGADVYGGAGGTGNYATTNSSSGYTLNLSTTNAQGINYFGYWLSALDSGNQVSFYKGNTLVASYSPASLSSSIPAAYYGNPNGGGNSDQAYVFLNFYDTNDTFDRVVFAENPASGGYESDNHTVGRYTAMSGTVISSVPEPATWVSLILGFGIIGGAMRSHRRRVGERQIG